MDHDHIFKELLTTFFLEFLDVFFPDLARDLDPDFGFVPMSQELFTDINLGESREVDLLMKVKFRGQETFFLIHVENQATAQSDFPRRMFRYFAHLTLRYDLPVYPIVLFSYDAPARAEPTRFEVRFPGWDVLRFNYRVIQLNRLSWRKFARTENPAANALMTKMKIAPKERPKARLECLRMLASQKLDPARTTLIGVFIDRYLSLSADEMKQFERELSRFAPAERKTTMELVTSWELKGRELGKEEGLEQGLHEGKEEVLARLIRKRFGLFSSDLAAQLARLSSEQLSELAEALFDFSTLGRPRRMARAPLKSRLAAGRLRP